MNKFVLLVLVTSGGIVGGLIRGPFVPLMVYFLYGIFRPQFLWQYQLDQFPEIGWSFYLAVMAIVTYIPWILGIIGPLNDPARRVQPAFVATHWFMVLFGIWMSLSYGFANDQEAGKVVYQDFLKIYVTYLLATQVIRTAGQVWFMYMMITLAFCYIAIDVNHEYISSGYLVIYKRGFAGLDNNGGGLMIGMSVPLAYFAWEATRGFHRWFYILVMPLMIHAVVSSYSRGAMLSILLTAPLYMLYSRKRRFLIVSYIGIIIMIPFMAGKEIEDRFLSVEQAEADESFNSRLDSWDAGRQIANDYPLFGAGVRNSPLISKDYGADQHGRVIHSNYIQIAADMGWVGLLIYLGFYGFAFLSIWRARIRLWNYTDPDSVRTVAMLGGIECSLWVFAIGSTALSLETFELPYMMMLLGAQVWALCNAKISGAPFGGNRPMMTVMPMTPQTLQPQSNPRFGMPKPRRRRNTKLPTRADFRLPPPPPNGSPPESPS